MSSNWKGYYKYQDVEYPMNFQVFDVNYINGKIYGKGKDQVGQFQMNGTIQGGIIKFVKKYFTHNIIYQGMIQNNEINGKWAWQQGQYQQNFKIWENAAPS